MLPPLGSNEVKVLKIAENFTSLQVKVLGFVQYVVIIISTSKFTQVK